MAPAMPGQLADDFASEPRAESAESTESFQPHFWEKTNLENECWSICRLKSPGG